MRGRGVATLAGPVLAAPQKEGFFCLYFKLLTLGRQVPVASKPSVCQASAKVEDKLDSHSEEKTEGKHEVQTSLPSERRPLPCIRERSNYSQFADVM